MISKQHSFMRRGFTLTEIGIVLGVIGIIAAGIWSLANGAWEKTKQEKLTEAIFTTVKNTRSYYMGQNGISGTFSGLSPVLSAAGVLPGDMRRVAPTCSNVNNICFDNPWGTTAASVTSGSYGVCPWAVGGTVCAAGPVPLFSIHVVDVPSGSCVQAVLQNSGGSAPPGLVDVVVNGTSMVATGGNLPPKAALLQTKCSGAAFVPVDFVFRIIPPAN